SALICEGSTRCESTTSIGSYFALKALTHWTCSAPTTTEELHAADPSASDSPWRNALEGVSRASWRVSGRGGCSDEYSFPAPECDRQRPSGGQRGHCTATRCADGLGRSDLADAAGQVGSLARDEGPRAPTEDPRTPKDRLAAQPSTR